MNPGLEISETEQDGVTIITLSGAVDTSSAHLLKTRVGPLCRQQGSRILLDCASLSYLNSMCMGQFAAFQKTCIQSGGKIVLCNLESTILDVMKLLTLDKVLTLCATRDEGLMMLG